MWAHLQNTVTNFIEKYRWFLIAQIFTLLCCGIWCFNNMQSTKILPIRSSYSVNKTSETQQMDHQDNEDTQAMQPATSSKMRSIENKSSGIGFVDVKGAICKPGIYQVLLSERIIDVLKKAGGVTPEADLTQLNQASKLTDEMVIYVPTVGEEGQKKAVGIRENGQDESLVNLNQATGQELMTLPGVGQKRAQDIITYREDKVFKSVADLGNVPGFGAKMLEKLEPLVQV